MNELPNSWAICSVSDVTAPVATISTTSADDREIAYIDISSIDNIANRISEPKRLSLSEAPSRARQIVATGDVLFSTVRPYLRNIAQVPEALDGQIASTGFAVLRVAEGIVPVYLYYKAISRDFVAALTGEQYGVSYPAVKEEQVRSQPFELPPTREQHRIVAKIDELFSELDKAVESLTLARAQLKTYRQSLLKSAFEGRLTADWRAANPDKLEPSDVLLAHIRGERDARYCRALDDWQSALAEWHTKNDGQERPSKPRRPDTSLPLDQEEQEALCALPSDWAWARPVDFSAPSEHAIGIGPFGSNLKVSDYRDRGVPLIFVKNITRQNFSLDQKFVDEGKANELRAHAAMPNDILITKMGDPPGDCAIYPSDAPPAIITADCLKFRVWDEFIERAFACYCIASAHVQKQLGLLVRGVAQKKISVERFKTIALPLPSLAEQVEIVARLDAVLSVVTNQESEIDATLNRTAALRQSILKKAFSGQLVPQDPTDEPAADLLARLREQAPPARTRRRTTA